MYTYSRILLYNIPISSVLLSNSPAVKRFKHNSRGSRDYDQESLDDFIPSTSSISIWVMTFLMFVIVLSVTNVHENADDIHL